MAVLRQSQKVENKNKLSHTLRNWLPILHASLGDLQESLTPFVEGNPIVEVQSGFEEDFETKIPKKIFSQKVTNSRTQKIEASTIKQKSLYEVLDEQIIPPLFPTPISQKIASFVIENLDADGYYDGDTKKFCQENNISKEQFEKIRLRFAHLEPSGIGALNLIESFLFQLENTQANDNVYKMAKKLIQNLQDINDFTNEPYFNEAVKVISTFKNPPAIEYFEDSIQIIPDLLIFFENGNIEVKLNDEYYPTIKIDTDYAIQHQYITQKIKEAKSLVDALEMRKATLYKIGLMIVEYQYDFFMGGDIMPLTLKTLADEFGHNPSTISRAIANKYIACDRGTFAMKEFFTTAIEEDISNTAIKEYLTSLIKKEDHSKPLSDIKLLELIQQKFQVKIVRRTIAKYRKQLNIAGSNERKKLYQLGH
ncbi:RNA polymerase sigma-54 factor RpoN [hydrothermal vent metagenome]|uniref:RNA polymerase sigma-54 factor RpoN n=1 Tax=hydrothermal vent metagenome TaxID=652676 RepID=A0A1W1D2C7_9ZZZZ